MANTKKINVVEQISEEEIEKILGKPTGFTANLIRARKNSESVAYIGLIIMALAMVYGIFDINFNFFYGFL